MTSGWRTGHSRAHLREDRAHRLVGLRPVVPGPPRSRFRRPSTEDRRVKILEVTEAGRETFTSMEALFSTPPSELFDAPRDDLLALVRVAERLAGTTGTFEPADESVSVGPASGGSL